MRIAIVVATVALAAAPARADEPRRLFSASVTVADPVGHANDVIDRSPGLRLAIGTRIHPAIAVVASIDHMFTNENFGTEGNQLEYNALQVGLRAMWRAGPLCMYGEAVAGLHQAGSSGVGFRVGAGIMYGAGSVFFALGLGITATQAIESRADGPLIGLHTVAVDLGIGKRF